MSSNAEPEKRLPPGIDERVAEEMERIDDDFLNGLHDHRFDSGVPEEERPTDLEFIQMSGLTYRDRHTDDAQPDPEPPQPAGAESSQDAEPKAPISFYEKGVGDVDTDMSPGATEDSFLEPPEGVRSAEDASPIAELRDIIADLSRDIPESLPPESVETQSEAAPAPGIPADADSLSLEDTEAVLEDAETAAFMDADPDEAEDEPEIGQYAQFVVGDVDSVETDDESQDAALDDEQDAGEPVEPSDTEGGAHGVQASGGDRWAEDIRGSVGLTEFSEADYADEFEGEPPIESADQSEHIAAPKDAGEPVEPTDAEEPSDTEGVAHGVQASEGDRWAEDIVEEVSGLTGFPEAEYADELEDEPPIESAAEPEDWAELELAAEPEHILEAEGGHDAPEPAVPVPDDDEVLSSNETEGESSFVDTPVSSDRRVNDASLENDTEPEEETFEADVDQEAHVEGGLAESEPYSEHGPAALEETDADLPEEGADFAESGLDEPENLDADTAGDEREAPPGGVGGDRESPPDESALQGSGAEFLPEQEGPEADTELEALAHGVDLGERHADAEAAFAAAGADEEGRTPDVSFEEVADEEPEAPNLREAEALLEALEAQPRDIQADGAPSPPEHEPASAKPAPSGQVPADLIAAAQRERHGDPEMLGQDDPAMARRRKSRTRSRRARRIIRIGIAMLILAVLAAGAYQAWVFGRQQLRTPDAQMAQAQRLSARGEHGAAARLYQRAANALPERDAQRAEALFGAAYNAFSAGMHEGGRRSDLEQARAVLETFQGEYPAHTKIARATVLHGIILFELEQPRQAIEKLRHPELRLRDPGAALPILRTLARAHAKLGEFDMARRAYLQAARLEDNYTPDEDYYQVGLIYERLAEHSESPEAQREHLDMALHYWRYAVKTPGIDRLREEALKRRIALLESRLAGPEQDAPADGPDFGDVSPARALDHMDEPSAPGKPTKVPHAVDGMNEW